VLSAVTLASTSLVIVGSASPAHATEPGCVNGGVYALWARGSGQWIGDVEAARFKEHIYYALGVAGVGLVDWAELGNIDRSVRDGQFPDDTVGPDYEYPAVPVSDWNVVNVVNGAYAGSVTKGTDELVRHLNQRYSNGNCANETTIIGGYSQGADVIGWALERNGGGGYVTLSAAAKNHIGYVALYGDPKYRGSYSTTSGCPVPVWVRANTTCISEGVHGALQARSPYLPPEFYNRTGSWCDNGDGVCDWPLIMGAGTHTSAYRNWWIWQSAAEVAAAAKHAVQLRAAGLPAGSPPGSPGGGSPPDIAGAPGGTATYDGTIRISGTNGQGATLRSAPSASASNIGNITEGTVVHPSCYAHGQNVGGTSLWWKIGNGYYSSFYDSVPLEWQNAIEQHYGIQSCNAPPPDSDFDGTPDTADACPHVYVAANSGCPRKGDFSLDGKSDIAAFYRYDNNAIGLWLWNGQSNLYSSGPYSPWGAYSGWDASLLIPAGTADFNGDKIQDTAAFYGYANGALGLDIWYGNAQAGLNPYQAWHVPSAWEKDRVIPAGVGDFNGDGRADVAAFYRYDNNQTSLYVWYGQADLNMAGPYSIWNGPGWDGSRVIPVGAGDIDGDGHADISTFYRHDGGMVDQNVWFGNGAGAFTLGRPWHVDTGWDASRFIPLGVTDINGDGKADTIAVYRHDGNYVDMRVWNGTGSRIGATNPDGPWSASGWDGNRIIPAGTGDYNGDGKMDIASFYRYDGQAVGLNIWYGDGSGGLSPFGAWYVETAWEGARVIPPAKG